LFMMGFMAEGLTAIKEEVSDMRRSFLRSLEEDRQHK